VTGAATGTGLGWALPIASRWRLVSRGGIHGNAVFSGLRFAGGAWFGSAEFADQW
jgi:hypothetical protein